MTTQLHPILMADVAGNPHSWISFQSYAYYETKGAIAWKIGEKSYTLHGGVQRATNIQSTLDVATIVGLRGQISPEKRARYNNPHLTSTTLYARDLNMCAYCGRQFTSGKLTKDHIKPKSQKGPSTWMNLVTCCKQCNLEKNDRTPEQAGMPLLYVPYVPNRSEFLILQNKSILCDQMDFLLAQVPKHSRIAQHRS